MRIWTAAPCILALGACGLEVVGGATPLADAGPASADAGSDASASGDEGGAAGDASAPGRKKSITFDPSKVAGALGDFPVWIDLVDADVGARARTDGADLFFTAADGTPLAHEIQRWDAAAPHLTAWVRLPQLSNGAPTVIFLRYGDPTSAPAPAPASVFSSSFAAVWHLDDPLTSTSIAEATGTSAGVGVALAPAQQVAAKLGGGVDFTGADDEITFTNPLSGSGPHTISMWVSQRATADNDALIVLGNGACGQSRWLHGHFNANTLAVGFYCNDWANPAVSIEGAGFVLVHWVFDSANGTSSLYQNGVLAAGPFVHTGTAVATAGSGGHIGNAPAAWGAAMGAHATIDEVRIAKVARSAAWISTEYANQSSPGTFYAVGSEQSVE